MSGAATPADVFRRRAPIRRMTRTMERGTVRRLGLAVCVSLAVGCAAGSAGTPRQAIPDYSRFSHSWRAPHVTLYWKCAQTETGSLRLDGLGVNPLEPVPPRYLELVLTGFDAQGRPIARAHTMAKGFELLQGFPAAFRLELARRDDQVRVDLAYRYEYRDDSFEGPFRWTPRYITGRIPDACGADRHRLLNSLV